MKKIINNILHRLKEDSLAKRTELVNRTVVYKNLKDIKRVLVFWMGGEDEKGWMKLLTTRMREAKFDRLCFVPAGVEMLESDNLVIMRNEDLGFGGKIQNPRLHTMLAQPYDLLIDLTSVSSALITYVLTNSQAHCIVGMKKEGGSADIIVDDISGTSDFINKLTGILAEINEY